MSQVPSVTVIARCVIIGLADVSHIRWHSAPADVTHGGPMPEDQAYPFDDKRDFDDAGRGFIAALSPGVVRNAAGKVVLDNDS